MSISKLTKLADIFEEKIEKEAKLMDESDLKKKEIKGLLVDIKKLSDLVYQRYQSLQPDWMSKIYDVNYRWTQKDLQKAKALLEGVFNGLDS